MKRTLTDKGVKALKPAAKPYEVMDTEVRSFGLRVLPSGVKSFVLYRRFPGSANPVRRSLGTYGVLSLAEAREKGRQWNALAEKGLDPAIETVRRREAEQEAKREQETNTFGAAFEAYLKRKASKLKSGPKIESEIRREFAGWMQKPLADIDQREVKTAIQAVMDRGAATQAHTIFAMLRGFLNWVVDTGDFNLAASPCNGIKPAVLIGERNIRSRTLKDYEIGTFWHAAEAMGYPFGKLFQLLALTALRRDEAANAEWSEIDFESGLWVIPGSRMKNGAAHAIPLTPDIVALLESLPRFTGGDFVFSTTGGRRPVSGFSKAKARLDKLMAAELAEQGKPFENFVLHDVRRTCRTRFSGLAGVEDTVRELLLAHARPGLHKVYDLHLYQEEKAAALTLWHARLRAMVEPKPDNVIRLAAGA